MTSLSYLLAVEKAWETHPQNWCMFLMASSLQGELPKSIVMYFLSNMYIILYNYIDRYLHTQYIYIYVYIYIYNIYIYIYNVYIYIYIMYIYL